MTAEHWVGIFAERGVRELAGDDQGGFGQWLQRGSISFGGDLGSGSTSVTLEQDSTVRTQ